MAQMHALLLISPKALTADEIMEELKISRGNTTMNLHALMDWGLVHKEPRAGERKEFFVAEKNMIEIVRRVVAQRKKRELEPMLKVLEEVSEMNTDSEEGKEFARMVREIQLFSQKAETTLETLIKSDSNWLIGAFFKMMR
jgi:DNA-binding transcriptional regulator GbsR (MarR family)